MDKIIAYKGFNDKLQCRDFQFEVGKDKLDKGGIVKNKKIVGASCLVFHDGKERGFWHSGFADVENKKEFSRDTIIRLYMSLRIHLISSKQMKFHQNKFLNF